MPTRPTPTRVHTAGRPRRSDAGVATSGQRHRRRLAGGLLAAAAVTLAACSSSSSSSTTSNTTTTAQASATLSSLQSWPTSTVSLLEQGSSLLYPLFNLWAPAVHTAHPTVSVQTESTGSGAGITAATNGTTDIGASDAYLSNAQRAANPNLENVPLAISAQFVGYNVPGVTPAGTHLKLSGKVISAIYQGQITNWDNAKITALNPGVHIPATPIVTVHRADSSGDTFLFTSFLAAADPSGWGTKVPPGTTVTWPNAPGALSATGNGGMVTTCGKTPGCIAYIGVSYQNQATTGGIDLAELQNKSGHYELPTKASISAEAASFASTTPSNGTVSMIYGPAADGYPIINYEYAVVSTQQSSAAKAQAIKALLAWCIDPSNGNAASYLDQVNFVPLPSSVAQISVNLLAKVTG